MPSQKLLFMCSGGGGNLRFIHKALKHKWLPFWDSLAVIADKECGATAYARQHSIPFSIVDCNPKTERSKQAELLRVLKDHNPSHIITTIHRILDDNIVSTFAGRLFNLHYSLLPAFAGTIGARPVTSAQSYGACLTGATVHHVTSELDAGKPISQIALALDPTEPIDSVMNSVFRSGCIALFAALSIQTDAMNDYKSNGMPLIVNNLNALLNPAIPIPEKLMDEGFWEQLK
jgi:phosphoribosylglycinamide formyltransferase 1